MSEKTKFCTVSQLIEKLKEMPQDVEVRIWCDDFCPIVLSEIEYEPPDVDTDGTVYGNYVCINLPDAWDYEDRTKIDAIKRILG